MQELSAVQAFERWIKGEPVEYWHPAWVPEKWYPIHVTGYSAEFWTGCKFRIPVQPLTLPEAVKIAAERAKERNGCVCITRGSIKMFVHGDGAIGWVGLTVTDILATDWQVGA